jgi:hypothetical protein
MSRSRWFPGLLLAALLRFASWAAAETTVLQNGVSPTPQYQGCRDTWISDEPYERNRAWNDSETLRTGGKRHALLYFDLSAIPADHFITSARLRLAYVGYPRREGKEWPKDFTAYALSRPWSPGAKWDIADPDQGDQGKWTTPGGDIDTRNYWGGLPPIMFEGSEAGISEPGNVARNHMFVFKGTPHVVDFNVTLAVRYWHSGKHPNYGLLLKGKPAELASSRWYVPSCRPELEVSHSRERKRSQEGLVLGPLQWPAQLDPSIAETPDRGKAQGEYAVVRVGQHPSCALRGKSTDAYVKRAELRFPGTWGGLEMCRVGGRAGDLSSALLYFDLTEIPKTTSIEKALLHLSLTPYTNQQAAHYHLCACPVAADWGAQDLPGWHPAAMTFKERRAGQPWSNPQLISTPSPYFLNAAFGRVVTAQVERRGEKRTMPAAMEFDLTGVVRHWVQGDMPNRGILLDNRVEGGAYDFYSCRAWQPELRPYLEISLSPSIAKKPEPMEVKPALPPGDYWVEAMREVHKKFRGTPGTLAQYGDSITVTMAFLAPHAWGKNIDPKNCPPEVRAELDLIERYANRKLWIEWKEAQWGNTGMMRSDWLLRNIDTWQKKMNPEAAVILFGTNDLGGLMPPEYTENMVASLRRMMANGTVPMLTTVPPKSGADEEARDMWLAHLSIARELKIPVIDYYGEILRRRPDDWDGRLPQFKGLETYEVPTLISGDGTHPSNPKEFQNDFGEKALSANGYNLRNYLTLRTYAHVIAKVFAAK